MTKASPKPAAFPEVDPATQVAIARLAGLYDHLLDNENWGNIDQLFTADVEFDAQGTWVAHGLAELRERLATSLPRDTTHNTQWPLVVLVSDEGIETISKYISVWHSGRIGVGEYHDLITRTAQGWRIRRRRCVGRKLLDVVLHES